MVYRPVEDALDRRKKRRRVEQKGAGLCEGSFGEPSILEKAAPPPYPSQPQSICHVFSLGCGSAMDTRVLEKPPKLLKCA